MLAYVFCIDRGRTSTRAGYEDAASVSKEALSRHASPGLVGVSSWRIEAVPWLGDQPGYEDWCLLQGPGPWTAQHLCGRRRHAAEP